MFLDIFKGFIIVFFLLWFLVYVDGVISIFFINGLIVGLFVIFGYVYLIYLKFNGGKVVVISVGVVLGVNFILFFILVIIFFSVLKIFKYVFLLSIIVVISCVIGLIIIYDYILFVVSGIVLIILIIWYKFNIVRIFKGEEFKIKWM